MIQNGILRPLALLFLIIPAAVEADQYGDFTYSTDGTNVSITKYTGSNDVVIIPNTINSQPVTSIGDWAFSLSSLVSVTIPDGLTSIGEAAFHGCTNLASITLPSGITNIGADSFNSCSLSNVTIPASVIGIGEYAFFYCTNLTNITVDTANSSYSSADGVLFNKNQSVLMQFPFGKTGGYTIPGSVSSIADEAFGMNDHGRYPFPYSSCVGLTNLIIPGSVTNIGDHAFSHCAGLISVTLSNGIVSLGADAFSWCGNLNGITIPDSVGSIGQSAFYYSGLTNITIPGSVTNLGAGAFAVCSSLTIATMEDGVNSIEEAGFNFCTNLTSVTIPASVTSIGPRAFWFCTALTNVIIPGNVTNVGNYAFSACSSLINITVNADNAAYSSRDGVLFNKDQTVLLQFPGGRGGSYTVPRGVTSIGDYAFGGYDPYSFHLSYPQSGLHLRSLTIPNTVTIIGTEAFSFLTNLSGIYFEGNSPSDASDLSYDPYVAVYYLPGTTGWEDFIRYAGLQTTLWNPQVQSNDGSFGMGTNGFGFNITGTTNIPVVVEAATNLTGPWIVAQNCTLTNGSVYFSDAAWTNYPSRFYRIRSP